MERIDVCQGGAGSMLGTALMFPRRYHGPGLIVPTPGHLLGNRKTYFERGKLMRKRFLSTLLILCMVLSILPLLTITARAASGGTPYTAGAPAGGNYTISSAEQLQALAETVNGGESYADTSFTLTGDIDLSGVCGTNVGAGGTSWTPIGNYENVDEENPFKGSFDGNGKTIKGVYINTPESDYLGLFGNVGENGTVKNLSVSGDVTGRYSVAGVVGGNGGGTVENCHYSGTVHYSGAVSNGVGGVGGVVGGSGPSYEENGVGRSGTVVNCSNSGTITAADGRVSLGGVVGLIGYNTVENCHNSGTITATGGGFADVGGVVGSGAEAGYVKNCYNTGTITVTGVSANAGGVMGSNGEVIENSRNSGSITATVTGDHASVGGVAGYSAGGVENCSNTSDVTITAEDVTLKDDIYTGGIVGENRFGSITSCDNTGTINVSIKMNTFEETYSEGKVVYIGGVVGSNTDGTVEDCHNDGSITSTVGIYFTCKVHVGGVAGKNNNAVTNCYNTGKIDGAGDNANVGGVVGVNHGTVTDCYNTKDVTGDATGDTDPYAHVGGVAGENYGTVQNCYNSGSITGLGWYADVGGVVGINEGTVKTCYNTGNVEGSSDLPCVGGIVGSNSQGSAVENCYNTGNATSNGSEANVGGVTGGNSGTIKNCYNTGAVKAIDSGTYLFAGGVAGNVWEGTVKNCYYLKTDTINNGLFGIGDVSGDTADAAEGLTDAQMKQESSFANWDFGIWAIDFAKNNGYPYLSWQTSTKSSDNTGSPSGTGTGYTITLYANPTVGGNVSGGGYYESGESAVVRTVPASGYYFARWTDEYGATVSTSTSYTFTVTMSRTLTAIFEPISGNEDSPASSSPAPPSANVSLPFTDVSSTNWFYPSVQYVYTNGLMTGDGNTTTFNPRGSTTRAMIWTVLGRMSNADVDGNGSPPWYAKARDWAITSNVSDGTNPTYSISRQELMTMLWRYIGSPTATADLSQFSDNGSVSDWANDAMQWAVSTGLIVGDNGHLNPGSNAKRSEVATIFMRFCANIIE